MTFGSSKFDQILNILCSYHYVFWLFLIASSYAKRAYELDQDNPEVHKWYAITIGSLGDYVGTQEKIANGFIFKVSILVLLHCITF